jgi:hypothetical protein
MAERHIATHWLQVLPAVKPTSPIAPNDLNHSKSAQLTCFRAQSKLIYRFSTMADRLAVLVLLNCEHDLLIVIRNFTGLS